MIRAVESTLKDNQSYETQPLIQALNILFKKGLTEPAKFSVPHNLFIINLICFKHLQLNCENTCNLLCRRLEFGLCQGALNVVKLCTVQIYQIRLLAHKAALLSCNTYFASYKLGPSASTLLFTNTIREEDNGFTCYATRADRKRVCLVSPGVTPEITNAVLNILYL